MGTSVLQISTKCELNTNFRWWDSFEIESYAVLTDKKVLLYLHVIPVLKYQHIHDANTCDSDTVICICSDNIF